MILMVRINLQFHWANAINSNGPGLKNSSKMFTIKWVSIHGCAHLMVLQSNCKANSHQMCSNITKLE